MINTIVNNPDEFDKPIRLVDLGVGSPSVYAFARDENGHIGLMVANKGDMFGKHDWIEVTDLSCIPVWEYKKLQNMAISIGLITINNESWLL